MKIKRYNAKDIVGVHPIDYFEDEDGEVVMYICNIIYEKRI